MIRSVFAALLGIALIAPASSAQDGPIRRAGRALDNTGKGIRNRVETGVERGQISAQEREVLNRVSRRIEWDKQLSGSTIQFEVQPAGAVVLRGSVISDAARRRAVDLVENTVGVTSIVDELAVVKNVRVIEAAPPARVIEVSPPVTVPVERKVIVKP